MPPAECPNCGFVSDMASAIDNENAKLKPGDVSICIACGHLMVAKDDLTFRNPTDDEIKNCAGDERIVAIMTALHHVKSK